MIKNAIFPTAEVIIKSNKSLIGLADEISQKILMDLRFGGVEKYIRNENPAVFIRPLLGLEVVLWHDLDEPSLFHLEVSNSGGDFASMRLVDKTSMDYVDISGFMAAVLTSNGFECAHK
jgi:hypothetical protein